MASQVLSGTGNVSYTNNTGQNVRIVINYMAAPTSGTFTLGWAGVSAVGSGLSAIGRNLAYVSASLANSISVNNAFTTSTGGPTASLPTELMLAPGQTFSGTCGAYNIVVIPEAG